MLTELTRQAIVNLYCVWPCQRTLRSIFVPSSQRLGRVARQDCVDGPTTKPPSPLHQWLYQLSTTFQASIHPLPTDRRTPRKENGKIYYPAAGLSTETILTNMPATWTCVWLLMFMQPTERDQTFPDSLCAVISLKALRMERKASRQLATFFISGNSCLQQGYQVSTIGRPHLHWWWWRSRCQPMWKLCHLIKRFRKEVKLTMLLSYSSYHCQWEAAHENENRTASLVVTEAMVR